MFRTDGTPFIVTGTLRNFRRQGKPRELNPNKGMRPVWPRRELRQFRTDDTGVVQNRTAWRGKGPEDNLALPEYSPTPEPLRQLLSEGLAPTRLAGMNPSSDRNRKLLARPN